MKNFLIAGGIFVFFFVAGFFLGSYKYDQSDNKIKRERITMGTLVEIIVRGESDETANNAINKAFAEFERINNVFSTYNDKSNISIINNDSSNAEFIIDSEMFYILSKCDDITRTTNGAFDIATGNIINLWSFSSENPTLPEDSSLVQSLENSGWENIELIGDSVLMKKKNVSFNFGAIVKGYAVDCAAKVLSDLGITDFLINAGGEIKTSGSNWKVGIQHPRKTNEIVKTLMIDNISVATSGDYEQYFELNGKRYHHIIDPANGFPANGCQSVTIIAKDDLIADAFATGIFVLGKDEGMKLIESNSSLEGMIINNSGEVFTSSGFNKYVWR